MTKKQKEQAQAELNAKRLSALFPALDWKRVTGEIIIAMAYGFLIGVFGLKAITAISLIVANPILAFVLVFMVTMAFLNVTFYTAPYVAEAGYDACLYVAEKAKSLFAKGKQKINGAKLPSFFAGSPEVSMH